MCDDDDDDESCNKCYALIIVVFKRRDLRKMCRVFLRKKKLLFKKNVGTHVLQEFIYAALRQFELHMYA
jgi:hypothetical protein